MRPPDRAARPAGGGRNSGDLAFERQHPAEHARLSAAAGRALGASAVEAPLTLLHHRAVQRRHVLVAVAGFHRRLQVG
ncbi:hypothetical protein ABT262_41180, partial [Amycolatopsis mediterranei]